MIYWSFMYLLLENFSDPSPIFNLKLKRMLQEIPEENISAFPFGQMEGVQKYN